MTSIIDFDTNGFGKELFTTTEYFGMSATGIAYDLSPNAINSMSNYDDMQSRFLVREYVADGKVKISASEWSDDDAVRSREEQLIKELVALGAEKISGSEMSKLCSYEPYESEAITWNDWAPSSTPAE